MIYNILGLKALGHSVFTTLFRASPEKYSRVIYRIMYKLIKHI